MFGKKPKGDVWVCKQCSLPDEGPGFLHHRQSEDDPTVCDWCFGAGQRHRAERLKLQKELAASVAGGLAAGARVYRDRNYDDRDIAKQAMAIADEIIKLKQ